MDTLTTQEKISMWIPILIFIGALVILGITYFNTGFIVGRDIELTGGTMIEFSGTADLATIRETFPFARFTRVTGVTNSIIAEIPEDVDADQFIADFTAQVPVQSDPTVRRVGPALGALFFAQTQLAIIVALIFMSIIVFILFRAVVPSLIIMFSVILDITTTLGIMNIIGVNLSLPVLAALLTLIGYSVDTDILLTTSVLKSSPHEATEKRTRAMRTGITMTLTTVVALTMLYFITGSFVLEQIALVLGIGLVFDFGVTWFTNSGILLWYLRRRGRS